MGTTQECYVQSWTNPGSRTQPKQQLYGHLLPISQLFKLRQTRHGRHCGRSKDKLISDILPWTPMLGPTSVSWSVKTYVYQLRAATRCSLEDVPEAKDDRDIWRECESLLSERLGDDDDDDDSYNARARSMGHSVRLVFQSRLQILYHPRYQRNYTKYKHEFEPWIKLSIRNK